MRQPVRAEREHPVRHPVSGEHFLPEQGVVLGCAQRLRQERLQRVRAPAGEWEDGLAERQQPVQLHVLLPPVLRSVLPGFERKPLHLRSVP